jgi:putative ATP-dependent endonuclease of OLD family
VKLLGPQGLDIPIAVLTDFDPKGSEVSQEDDDPDGKGVGENYGENRVVNHIMREVLSKASWKELDFDDVLELAPRHGIFLNEFTFEVDVFNVGAEEYFLKAALALSTNKKMHARFKALDNDPTTLDEKQFLKDIDSIGKGRFAQRLAAVILADKADVCPNYIKNALEYMREKLG